jgi:tetratricopeptide (TPR) repeat protein
LFEEERADYADREKRAAQLERLREELGKKRRIKSQVRDGRSRQPEPPPPVAPEAIHIRVLEEGEFIHYPASPADLREVLRRLPAGVTSGIRSIDLCLGVEYQSEFSDDGKPDFDPLTGREGSEGLPGVYQGRVLGTYTPSTARIRIFADVYRPDLPQREMWEFYLRLEMLSVLVHEVAHHFDLTNRVARGRWLADVEEKCEIFAEKVQHEWTQRYAVPYLEETYPQQRRRLDDWLEHYGGVRLPLALLAGDPRSTAKGGGISLMSFFGLPGAVQDLAKDVAAGKELACTRLGFARDLHHGEHYNKALSIIDRVLSEHGENLDALTLKADIYAHQGRYGEAQTLAERVTAANESCLDAWGVLADVYESCAQWPELVTATTRMAELADKWVLRRALGQRAKGHMGLGDLDAAAADIEALAQLSFPPRRLEGLRAELASRIEQARGT